MLTWLRNLKCGDTVVFEHLSGEMHIAKITRTTMDCVWVNELRFSRASGKSVSIQQCRILKHTPERERDIEARERAEQNRQE